MLFFNSILLPFDHERLFLYQTVSGKKNCVRLLKKSTEFEIDDCGFLNEKNAQHIFKQLSKNQYFHPFQQPNNIPVNGFGDYPQLSNKTSWKLYIDLDDCAERNQSITGYISTCLKILKTHFSSITLDFHFYVSHPKHWEYLSAFYDGMDQWAHCTDEMYCYFNGETLASMPDVLYQKLYDLNFRLILEMDSQQQASIFENANQPFHLHSIRYAFQAGTERDIVSIVNTHMEQFESTNIGIYPISCRFGQNPFSVDIDWIDKFDTEEFCNQFVSAIQSCTDIQRFEYAIELKLQMNGIGPLPGFGIPAYARVSSKTLFALSDRMNNPIDLLSTLDHYNHPSTNSSCVQCPIQHICGGFRPFDFTVEHDQAKMEALFTIYCTMQKRLIHRFIQKLYDPLLTQSN